MTQTAICQNRRKKARPRPKRFNLFIMKLTATVLLTACLQIAVAANGVAQVTLACKNESVANVLNVISKQTDYSVFYTNEVLKHAKPVTLSVKNTSVEEVLRLITKDQPFDFQIREKDIFIVKRKNSHTSKQSFTTDNEEISSLPDVDTIDVRGRVVNDKNEPVAGATVIIKGTKIGTSTDNDGRFYLKAVPENAVLVVSAVSIEKREISLNGKSDLQNIAVKIAIEESQEVVVYNTGLESVPKERATGSFVMLDNKSLNRRVGPTILDRLDGMASGVLFRKASYISEDDPSIIIRGRSTIYANDRPLVIVDNFEYDGDISNINPNDVESITILRDAAAASIWGAKSGNGVIVIKTKKGTYNSPAHLSFNSNVVIGEKPDYFYAPNLSVDDYIDTEIFLFDKNFYNNTLNTIYKRPFTPVVDILTLKKAGMITEEEANEQINRLRAGDVRNDLSKYFLKKPIKQQYSLSLSGGGTNQRYFLSIGYDQVNSAYARDVKERLTITASNTYSFFKNKLEVTTTLLYTNNDVKNNSIKTFTSIYPYARLTKDDNTPAGIPLYRSSFIDTVGGGRLLDWLYYPVDELRLKNNKSVTDDYRVNIGIKYEIVKGLDLTGNVQYGKGITETEELHTGESYFTRDLINRFTIINYANGNLTRTIPPGDILDVTNSRYTTWNLRGQLNFHREWANLHSVAAIAGVEIKDLSTSTRNNRLYGYDSEHGNSVLVDYINSYPTLVTGFTEKVPAPSTLGRGFADRFLSYYTNASYTYVKRYIFSLSARRDASNIFGVETNQKWVPLWSVGAAWVVSDETFYNLKFLQLLKLRASYGFNGNTDRSVTALLTTRVAFGNNRYNSPYASITNAPNPELRWERISILNIGFDFSASNKWVSGTVEVFYKRGVDIIGDAPLAPTTGYLTLRGNYSNIKGKGFDLTLNNKIIDSKSLLWQTQLLISYAKDWISNYKIKISNNKIFLEEGTINPVEGRPVRGLYSYRWAGLDPTTGDPQGYLDGNISKDYTKLVTPASINDLVFHGPLNPTLIGAIRNTIVIKDLEFSFNITGKAGYYFRRSSIDYNTFFQALLTGFAPGHRDFEARWQKPGDEIRTNVPSMVFPANSNRDYFYTKSEVLVEKGDHIRLQDVQLSYNLSRTKIPTLPVDNVKVYIFANNIGVLWKKNKYGIDPDFIVNAGYGIGPSLRSFALGARIDF
jgi:TonB-linked SusC/RagA family outer membrane protein